MISAKEKTRKRRIASISILSVLLVAILCFVFGYAIAEGWEAVGAWFTSKWATLTIVAVAVVVAFLIYFMFAVKDKEDFS